MIQFEVWGCRGSRNTDGSRIGSQTSCYALRVGADLFVFDAGRGLVRLADAIVRPGQEAPVERVHVFITHAHLDHWEGLKDAAWMWAPRNGLDLRIYAPAEALAAIERGHAPPAFVPLEILALGTLASLAFVEITAAQTLALPGATLRAVALHHYSGMQPHRRHLDTLGYHLAVDDGPSVAYLCDHEPTEATQAMEDTLVAASQLAIVDASYAAIAEQAFGHGSVEYAAALARRHPATQVLATHHGPMRTDDAIEAAQRTYGADCANLQLAIEGARARWNATDNRFDP
ncbi:MAG: MBL fold metallo-hydrolase [Proteobacteria bacterium]|nr:MBL fold metallo-hydrolase [Pseudomonadota bacterium]